MVGWRRLLERRVDPSRYGDRTPVGFWLESVVMGAIMMGFVIVLVLPLVALK